ncbi:nucleotide-diphospho-sugar transferase [Sparassis latifolia]
MPPKSSAGKEKDLADEDDVLQAVILADSFNKRFRPLTVGKPRCLLPICNATLLDWTFESLALAGVQEIFVICRSYAEQVKAAIRDSKWSKPSTGLKIRPIVTAKETFSPGDAMRDIYTHGIITSDFVLVTGDLVSNVHIDEVVRVHKERRRTNKDAIMTMVVKESGAAHRTRSRGDSGVFVLDAQTSECLHYEPVTGYPPKTLARIPREILAEHPEVEIRNDLIDCSIDVCSVEVPSLFQDNFDYADIRRDFVYGVLASDLLMKNIYCYVAREGYAARVADTRSYDAVSKDILSRWTFPLVPDDNHPGGHSYEHLRGNRYIAKDNSVVLSRTCKVGPNTLIGAHTHIADGASVHASVIGQRCTIGPNAVLRNAYIGDDTQVGARTVVEQSIVGARVSIGEGSTVRAGCLVGDGVVLGRGAKLERFERLSRKREKIARADADEDEDGDDEGEDSELEEVEANQSEDVISIISEGSNAVVWPRGPPSEEDEEDGVESYDNQRLMRIGDNASDLELSDPGSESESESESEAESSLNFPSLSRTSSATSFSATSAGGPSASALHALRQSAADSEFRSEVAQSLERAFAEGHSVENAAVELKTLRMASNVPLRRVREAVVAAIVDRVEVVEGDPAGQRAAIARVVGRWGALIDRIGGVDPVESVEVLQHHCAREARRLPLFGQVLAALYQADIVEEDDIRAWHARPASRGSALKPGSATREGMEKCWAVGKMMIEQFDEQESESESEEGEVQPETKGGKQPEESSDEEGEEEEEDAGEDVPEDPKQAPSSKLAPTKQSEESEGSEEASEEENEETGEEESEEEEPEHAQPESMQPVSAGQVKQAVPPTTEAGPAEIEESEEEADETEEEEGSAAGSEDTGEEESRGNESAQGHKAPAAHGLPGATQKDKEKETEKEVSSTPPVHPRQAVTVRKESGSAAAGSGRA